MNSINVIAISGSIRDKSTNTYLLQQAALLAPAHIKIQLLDIANIPFFNADLLAMPLPEAINNLQTALTNTDALIIATPEYNYSITGVLKNTLDWISAMQPNPLDNKAVSIMGVSSGSIGTARAQLHLRHILSFMNAYAVNRPEVIVSNSADKFDKNGKIIDQTTLMYLAQNLEQLYKLQQQLA
jgi:chromate reductase, NAD(P)H dehydrogenase (quinone)